jgi:hypothetical protein
LHVWESLPVHKCDRYLVDKLGSSFAPRFAEALFRCRRISEAGSQQLLLDTQGIRGLLLEFPASGALSNP